MKERPILFTATMVRAILEGRKTQTRRIVEPQPEAGLDRMEWRLEATGEWDAYYRNKRRAYTLRRCPYGVPGDRLWVRETFLTRGAGEITCYRADVGPVEAAGFGAMYGGWKPSIFMPRARSRITLEITGVRVERLQEISNEDAEAEGIEVPRCPKCSYTYQDCLRHMDHNLCGEEAPASAVYAYSLLWDSLNAKRAPWSSNPWVWVLSFNVVKGTSREADA